MRLKPRFSPRLRSRRARTGGKPGGSATALAGPKEDDAIVDLKRRREQLNARVAELQFDLGGLVYEMAVRDQIRVDVIVKRAGLLQDADAELGEVERILRLEQTSTAGLCGSCGAPHSSGATYCWQCGQQILQQVPSDEISQLETSGSKRDEPDADARAEQSGAPPLTRTAP